MLEPEALFEQNTGLAYWVLNQMMSSASEGYEDALQEAYIGLWKACLKFDPTRSKFSAFAVPCIRNNILMHFRYVRKDRGLVACSLDETIPETEGISFVEMIEDPKQDIPEVEMLIKDIMAKMPPKDRAVIELRMKGLPQRELASILGISQAQCSRILKKLWLKYFNDIYALPKRRSNKGSGKHN